MNTHTSRRLGVAFAIAAALALAFGFLAPAARAAVWGDDRPGVPAADLQQTSAGGNISGCSGSAVSTDGDGNVIDGIAAPGAPAASRGNALKVDYDGFVSYEGSTDTLIRNHSWDISIFGIAVKTGGDTNDEERTTDASDEKVSDYIPIRMSGKYFVSFEISGEGGSCSGSMWVEIDENPVGTIPWVAGTGFLLLGVAGLAFSIPTGAAAAAAGGGAAASLGAAGATPPETVIGGDPAPPPPPDDGQVIGDDGGGSNAGNGGDGNPPVIGA